VVSGAAAFTIDDRAFMARALFLAERGRGRTSPNPIVGAVIVRDGAVVGQGAHLAAGTAHAEVHALAEAGDRARGATLYCTLEPCAHQGRTPPCAPQVAAAGIARAVIATTDPNPKVAGRGIVLMREAGVRVDLGLLEDDAKRANAAFMTWVTLGRPHVTLKFAQSADGFVGRRAAAGQPRVRLTGAAMDRLMHRQRAEVDAIAVGSGTLLADDPLLTPRGAFRQRPLTRVVFDWRLRCGGARALYDTLETGPVILFTTTAAQAANIEAAADLARRGVDVIALADPDLAVALSLLAEREITSILVEGGPALQDACAAAGLVDRVQRIVTPVTLGGGVPVPALLALEGRLDEPIETIAGRDTLLEAHVHRID
jgi:diaminohydroxyphosphoribosylaminopyrimidine deaminase/5-amino-6-(5-phosphoribosylamino)uracil reductase